VPAVVRHTEYYPATALLPAKLSVQGANRQMLNITAGGRMQRIFLGRIALITAALGYLAGGASAWAQMMPGGGMGGMSGGGRPSMSQPTEEMPDTPAVEKPDAAAKKAFAAGMKSMSKARDFEAAAAKAANSDKKANALDKAGDAYNRALDQFTEALSNKGDMFEAWNNVGYIHLRLGAYPESIDDYNHALKLKPDSYEGIEHRGEAYLAVDRLDDAQGAYMDLFSHERSLADQLMIAMRKWLDEHRADAHGMRASDLDGFDKWLQERDGIAKQTAAIPR
jgi:tetratricopeptide (TPR) repeat protein